MGRRSSPSAPSAEPWSLFLDESGAFQDAGELATVTGLLVQERDTPELQQAWKDALCKVFPRMPFPQHARDLRTMAAHVAGHLLFPAPTRDDAAVAGPCAAAAKAIAEAAPGRAALARFVQTLGERRWPEYGNLLEVSAWLESHHPAIAGELAALREHQEEALFRLLQRIGEAYGPQRCFVVAAAAELPESGSPDAAGRRRYLPGDESWLELVESLLERVVALLRGDKARRLVVVRVDRRGLRRPDGSLDHVSGELLAECWAGAVDLPLPAGRWQEHRHELLPLFCKPSARPKLPEAEPVATYHPGLVLADLLSNRLFGMLHKHRAWRHLERAARLRLALPLQATARALAEGDALPALAAPGAPRQAIRDALAGRPDPAWSGVRPRWAAEQATLWCAALRRHALPPRPPACGLAGGPSQQHAVAPPVSAGPAGGQP